MRYTIATLALLAAVPAHGQHLPSYGIQQDQRSMPAIPDARLCSNVLLAYPSDHLLIVAKDNPSIRIHCGAVRSQSPVVLTFDTAGVNWYRTDAGYRHIVPGEGPDD
jgi:hypothetical protein